MTPRRPNPTEPTRGWGPGAQALAMAPFFFVLGFVGAAIIQSLLK